MACRYFSLPCNLSTTAVLTSYTSDLLEDLSPLQWVPCQRLSCSTCPQYDARWNFAFVRLSASVVITIDERSSLVLASLLSPFAQMSP